jgi:hypothetical protein
MLRIPIQMLCHPENVEVLEISLQVRSNRVY